MIIRCALVADQFGRLKVDLPNYTMMPDANTDIRAMVDVPDTDVSPDVAAFVAAYPTIDLTTPLAVPFPSSLASSWREFLARRYGLGNARWNPVIF
jgi:hypothetical protein